MKNEYEIRGETTAIFIKMQDGAVMETIIDTSDLELVNAFPNTWFVNKKTLYVHGNLPKDTSGKRGHASLHRWLFGNPKDKHVDHINHDKLDNRRSVNLRLATNAENCQNKKGAQKNSKSGVRGVHWNKRDKLWYAKVMLNKKDTLIGCFKDLKEAEKAVVEARKRLMPFSTL